MSIIAVIPKLFPKIIAQIRANARDDFAKDIINPRLITIYEDEAGVHVLETNNDND